MAQASALTSQRAQRLGKLLAASQLPPATIDGIREALPRLNLRQVDLLIDALAREQREWDRLEELLFEAEREVTGKLSTARAAQQAAAAAIVERAAEEVEQDQVRRIKSYLKDGD